MDNFRLNLTRTSSNKESEVHDMELDISLPWKQIQVKR